MANVEGQGDNAETDRKQCATHGLYFDPRVHEGCVVCRRGLEAAHTATEGGSRKLWGGLLALLCAAALGGGVLRVVTRAPDSTVPPPAPPVAVVTATDAAVLAVADADTDATVASASDQLDGGTGLALVHAAQRGDAAAVTQLLNAGAPVDGTDAQGRTALMFAAAARHLTLVRVLLAAGASVDARCELGMTPLAHVAAAGRHGSVAPIVGLLIGAGADIDARDGRGATPLLLAAGVGDTGAVAALLDGGASLQARDQRGHNALDYVVAPRTPVTDQRLGELRGTMGVLWNRGIERRLGTNAAWVPILFRDELDAKLRGEGHAALPAYAPTASPEPVLAQRQTRTERAAPVGGSLELWSTVGWQRAYPLHESLSGLLAAFRSLPKTPHILVRTEINVFSLPAGQRMFLSSDREGKRDWSACDGLLFELYRGPVRARAVFAGRLEEVSLEGRSLQRLGPKAFAIEPSSIDLTDIFGSGADRLAISVLNVLGWGGASSLYLNVRGPDAAFTIQRFTVRR